MGEYLEKGYFNDNWRINVNKNLIHAEALNLNGNIRETLSNIASAKDGVAISNIFIYGKTLLSYENPIKNGFSESITESYLKHSLSAVEFQNKIVGQEVQYSFYEKKKLNRIINIFNIKPNKNNLLWIKKFILFTNR